MISTIIFCLCLFLAIWFTILTLVRLYYKQSLDIQLFYFGGSLDRRHHTSYAYLVKGVIYD